MTTNQKGNMAQAANGAKGTYHANGFTVQTTKSDNYKNFCFKCGKPKSAHRLFAGCPK